MNDKLRAITDLLLFHIKSAFLFSPEQTQGKKQEWTHKNLSLKTRYHWSSWGCTFQHFLFCKSIFLIFYWLKKSTFLFYNKSGNISEDEVTRDSWNGKSNIPHPSHHHPLHQLPVLFRFRAEPQTKSKRKSSQFSTGISQSKQEKTSTGKKYSSKPWEQFISNMQLLICLRCYKKFGSRSLQLSTYSLKTYSIHIPWAKTSIS